MSAQRKRLFIIIGIILAVIIVIFLVVRLSDNNNAGSDDQSSIFHSDSNAGAIDQNDPASRTFNVLGQVNLVVKGRNSNVDVHVGDAGVIKVQVHAHNSGAPLTRDNASVRYNQAGNTLTIATDPAFQDLDYVVAVPASTHVSVTVDGGNVAISDVGSAMVQAGSGSLDLTNVKGSVDASTDSGDITGQNLAGPIHITGASGSIRLNNITGSLVAVTQSGDIVSQNAHLNGHSTLKTTNGSVRFNGALDVSGTYTMSTSSGDVTVILPTDAAFNLNASSGSGSVQNEFGSNAIGSGQRASLTATVNNGSINIEKAA